MFSLVCIYMNSDFGCALPLHQENLRFVKSAPALAQLKNSLLYAFISETLFGKAVTCPLFCHLIAHSCFKLICDKLLFSFH